MSRGRTKNKNVRRIHAIRYRCLKPVTLLIFACIGFLLLMFNLSAPTDVSANEEFLAFEAALAGHFQTGPGPAGPDRPVLFSVEETGEGTAQGFGAFTYASSLTQNRALVPRECASGAGNTAVDGTAVMVFPDGEMHLRRVGGQACLILSDAPFIIELQEEWTIIAGGTGRYQKATGTITKELVGILNGPQPGPFPFTATLSGTIRLNEGS